MKIIFVIYDLYEDLDFIENKIVVSIDVFEIVVTTFNNYIP